ncbi:MAG: hypothetical protein LUD69_08340 [Oscillospiraceae bacterium]|nr:hypothetical protein [Oscillospiraceae bacterium]
MKLLKRQNQSKQQVRRIHRSLFIRAGLAAVLLALLAVMVFTMSVAWYSNVVEAQTLTFTAESMDMEGWITLTDEDLEVLPGDQGEISFSVKNLDDTRSVTVTALVDKSALEEEMQQRIYFYVDQGATVNGESVARIYLSSSDSYGWTVLAGQTLELPDEDTPALCWQWVNDVLGYYVRLSEDDKGNSVTEYLRPIEYDYDTAAFDDNGYLESIDGVTLEEFLTQLTETDGYVCEEDGYTNGYKQEVDSEGRIWYCVDPDEGIWFYLCTEEEILAANAYDTELTFPSTSNSAAENKPAVQIHLSIARNTGADYLVTTAPELLELLSELSASESDTYTYITLDLTEPEEEDETYNVLSAALQVPANVALTIKLNGGTLTSTMTDGTVLSVASGGALTLTGGTWTAGGGSVTWMPSGDAVNLSGLSVNYSGGLTIDASETAMILENGTVTIESGVSGE